MKIALQPLMSAAAVTWLAAVFTFAQELKQPAPPARPAASLFPDKNLEKAVRRSVYEKRDNDQPLTEADVRNISIIEAKGMGITDLTGLEKCRALASLDLAHNRVRDLGPIKDLPLVQYLNLADNQVEDIAPLRGMVALQYIELSNNRVKNLAPLAGLTNLASLYLSRNAISDLTPITGLRKLWSLYLDGNPLAGLNGVGNLASLGTLSLNDTGISDLSGLDGVRNLKHLFLERNRIADPRALLNVVKRDAEGEQRFAPFLNLYLAGNPLSAAGMSTVSKLKSHGVRVRE